MLDFSGVFSRNQSVGDIVVDVSVSDLVGYTNEIYDAFDRRLAGLTDAEAVFVAEDPKADDPEGVGWNIAHVIVHLTAGLEEWAAIAAALARGVDVGERSRFETPWESVTTAAQVIQRMSESRRISLGYLGVWPDQPHLDNLQRVVEFFGPQNAIASHLIGYMHATMHLEQIEEIRRQAAAAGA